jgi:hypothetical protein
MSIYLVISVYIFRTASGVHSSLRIGRPSLRNRTSAIPTRTVLRPTGKTHFLVQFLGVHAYWSIYRFYAD